MIKPVHKVGDIVYLKTDPEQMQFMVTGIVFREVHCTYLLTCINLPETEHYPYEISTDRDMVMMLGLFEKQNEINE